MSMIFSIVFIILGLYLILTGLRGVVRKKPFVFSAKRSFWLVALAFSPSIVQPLYSFWELYSSSIGHAEDFEWSHTLALLFPLLIFPVILAFLWRQMRGYTILGVTDDSFRQALYAVLKDLQLPFEERLSKLRLTSIDVDLEANVAGWMGVANLRIKQPNQEETSKRIADELNHYFAASHVSINMITCVYYIIIGALIIGSAMILVGLV
jgi:hypothetical protein